MKSSLKIGGYIGFPKLCRYKNGEFVVLFRDYTCGTVVHSEDPKTEVGKYLDNWYKCDNEDYWEILPYGTTVLLKQE